MNATNFTLYRFFDSTGALLYVGLTISPSRRWREHERKAPWYAAVASVTREVFPTAEALAEAEKFAITTEDPIHNIALNPNKSARRLPTPASKLGPTLIPEGLQESLHVRWAAVGIDPVNDCLGEVTECECIACHTTRFHELEDLHANYEWHPDLAAEVASVEAMYYGGHWLSDWYYDLGDVDLFGRMRLVGESKTHPIPVFAEFGQSVAHVGCPFCADVHRHFFTSGTPLDHAIESGCSRMPGLYVLVDDYIAATNALYAWGDRSAKVRAA